MHPATSVFVILLSLLLQTLLSSPSQTRSRSKKRGIVFLIIWLAFLINFRWRGSGDVVAASLQPFALLRDGNLYLDNYYKDFLEHEDITWVYRRNGHVLSMYSSAPGLLLVPFYLVPALAHVEVTDLLIHQLQKIGASCMVALSAYLLLIALEDRIQWEWAVLLTFAYALGTSCLSVSSQAIWQHGPGQLFVSWGLYSLLKIRDKTSTSLLFWSGFAFAMAIWCRYSNAFVFAILLSYLLIQDREGAVRFMGGAVTPIFFIMADNYFHSGHLLKTGYQSQALHFTIHGMPGFLGLLFSPARGLFLFSPIVVFSIWGFAASYGNLLWRLWRFLGAACLAVLLFYSMYTAWPGGWCFGPRYLAELSPLLIIGILPVLDRISQSALLERLFKLSLLYSILVQSIGAFFSWHWEEVSRTNVWNWQAYPVAYLTSQMFVPRSRDLVEGFIVSLALVFLMGWFMSNRKILPIPR